MRPEFAEVYMALAERLSRRSTCKRLAVGCVITSTDHRKVLSVGYNGNAAGLPNQCDRDTPGDCGDLHAEENAVINCDSPRYVEKYVYVTHLPCVMCAKRLINLGNVKQVIYANDYRVRDAYALLRDAGINVYQRTFPVDPHDALHLAAQRVEHLENLLQTAVADLSELLLDQRNPRDRIVAVREALQNEIGVA